MPPLKFKVVGVAQNLDIAKEPWAAVKSWCDPDPETEEEAELAIRDRLGFCYEGVYYPDDLDPATVPLLVYR